MSNGERPRDYSSENVDDPIGLIVEALAIATAQEIFDASREKPAPLPKDTPPSV